MNFKYTLGETVVSITQLQAVLNEIAVSDRIARLEAMSVVERISCECVGGAQLFYHCERWDGAHGKYAEGSLIPSREAWDQWLDAMMKAKAKHDQTA